jgi:hypothetical protein
MGCITQTQFPDSKQGMAMQTPVSGVQFEMNCQLDKAKKRGLIVVSTKTGSASSRFRNIRKKLDGLRVVLTRAEHKEIVSYLN